MSSEQKIITSISTISKKKINRVGIYCGEELLAEVESDCIYKTGIKRGICWTEELAQKVKSLDDKINAARIINIKLSFRPRSVYEMRAELLKEGIGRDEAEEVLGDFILRGILNDVDFADKFISNALKINDWGPRRIEAELRRKGIASDIIDNALEKSGCIEIQQHRIEKILGKKIRLLKNDSETDKRKLYIKLMNLLSQKGYDRDISSEVLKDKYDLDF